MAREMTPQERAAAFIKSTFPLHLREDGEPCDGDIEDVVAHDQQTRRAALLEAAEVAITYGERARDEDLSGSYTSELIVQALDRLAQEG